MVLGRDPGSQGSYTLFQGSLNVTGYYINTWVDDGYGGYWDYSYTSGRLVVGDAGAGIFTQTGGTITVRRCIDPGIPVPAVAAPIPERWQPDSLYRICRQ